MNEDRTSTHKSICKGEWERNKTAGGANIEKESYGANPQFKLFLPEVDKDAFMASCVISLMQYGSKERDIAIGETMELFILKKTNFCVRTFCISLSIGCERKTNYRPTPC